MNVRPRLRLRTMVGLVALSAVGLAVWEHFEQGSSRYWARIVGSVSNDQDRWEAVRALGKKPEGDGGIAVPALLASLKDPSQIVRRQAAEALGRFPASAYQSVPALCDSIKSRDDATPLAALDSIERLTELVPGSAPAAIAGLMGVLGDPRPRVRLRAASILGTQGMAKRVAAAVGRDLSDRSPVVRLEATRVMRALGDDACKVYREELLARLGDADAQVVVEAAAALGDSYPSEAALALVRAFPRLDQAGRMAAENALAALGPMTGEAAPTLAAMVAGSDPAARWAALIALSTAGTDAAVAIPAIEGALNDPNPSVQQKAADALSSVGRGNPRAFDALVRRVRGEPDPWVRQTFVDALIKIGPIPPP